MEEVPTSPKLHQQTRTDMTIDIYDKEWSYIRFVSVDPKYEGERTYRKAYNTFVKYTIGKSQEVCNACCVTDDEEATA